MQKYRIIVQDIAQKIQSGIYAGGARLPSEDELCKTYQVSRITVKRATDQLVQLGLINKRRGAGSFVKDMIDLQKASAAISEQVQFTGFTRQFAGRKIFTEINQFVILPAAGEAAEKMRLTEDHFVYYICRTRFVDDEPYVVEYTYMPVDTIPGITKNILLGSIYSHILDTLQLKPQSAHRTIRALMATEQEKQYFRTDEPFAVLEIEQVAYLDDGRIFEFSKSRHRGDKYTFNCVSVW